MSSDPVHALRYRIADLLADIETQQQGLDARTATTALLETAYGAALTFCASADRARRHVDAIVDKIHGTALAQDETTREHPRLSNTPARGDRAASTARAPLTGRTFLAVTVAILSWATIVFMAHRGPVSPWNLLGPLFCTALAVVSAYRSLVAGGYLGRLTLSSRPRRLPSS